MNKKQHAYCISSLYIEGIKDRKSNRKDLDTFVSNEHMKSLRWNMSNGEHLATYETYKRKPIIQIRIGMNCKLTKVGLPFLRYSNQIKVYMWGDWVSKSSEYLNGMNFSTIRNITMDNKIMETGIVFFTIGNLSKGGNNAQ